MNWPSNNLRAGERLQPAPRRAQADIDRRSTASHPTSADVIIIGAGVIGLSIGWRLAARNLSVAIFDRTSAGAGTSLAATGMLAAQAELEPGGNGHLALALESQKSWPNFRAAVEAESGIDIDYRDHGALIVALGREEVERLRFRHDLLTRAGLTPRWLGGPQARSMEPGLRPTTSAAVFCEEDHQIDPRRLIPALCRAFEKRGGHLVENCPVESLDFSGGRVSGVMTDAGRCRANVVVIATGAWTAFEHFLPDAVKAPVRPLKGQALALRMTAHTGMLKHVVWTEQVHLAPKADGRLIVGATMEERGFDSTITAGGAYALLEGARRALPSIEEMELETIWSGLRPTSDDDAPLLGPTSIDGLLIATGHHRNGFLLAPITATAIESLVTSGEMPDVAKSFGLDRFRASTDREMEGTENANTSHR